MSRVRRHWEWGIPVLTLAVLLAPMLLTDRTFVRDWPNHVWLVWIQQLKLEHLGHPSWFFHYDQGAFFAWYAFYGGTLYTLTALLGSLLGSTLAAVLAMYTLAFAAAYGGWTWLAWQIGLRGWRMQVPGFLYVTSAYYLTVAYGRGAFPETVALSMLPLVAAAALHLLRAERVTAGAALALLVSVALFTGSHTLTLVWGGSFLAAVALISAIAVGRRALPPRRRVLAVAGMGALGAAVNLWFLVPLLLYATRTQIAHTWSQLFGQTEFSQLGQLLRPLRDSPQDPGIGAYIQAQLPVPALAWAAVVLVALRRAAARHWRVVAAGLGLVLLAFVALAAHPSAIRVLPRFWDSLQFPYRLVSYATLSICALVAVALVLLERAPAPRRALADGALAAIMLFTAVLAVHEVLNVPSSLPSRQAVFASADRPPPTWYDPFDYGDYSAPVVRPTLPGRIVLRPQLGDSYRYRLAPAASGTIATNVMGGPYLVRVRGAQHVGRTPEGFMVLRVDARAGERQEISFSPVRSVPRELAVAASLAALLASVLLIAGLAAHGARRRRAVPA